MKKTQKAKEIKLTHDSSFLKCQIYVNRNTAIMLVVPFLTAITVTPPPC